MPLIKAKDKTALEKFISKNVLSKPLQVPECLKFFLKTQIGKYISLDVPCNLSLKTVFRFD